jgi:acyl carrier protein
MPGLSGEEEKKLDSIIQKTLRISEAQYHRGLKMGDVTNWDSLGHLRLIFAIEAGLNRKFPMAVIPKLTTVSLIIEYLQGEYLQGERLQKS